MWLDILILLLGLKSRLNRDKVSLKLLGIFDVVRRMLSLPSLKTDSGLIWVSFLMVYAC